MAKFKITPTTTVAELKEQFRNEIGGVLRVYEGRSQAPADATLVSLGAKEGELECRTSRTVGKFEEAFQKDLNLKVKVYTKDENVSVLDGITLATVKEIPNMSTHAKMEKYLSYKRDEKAVERKDEEEISVLNSAYDIAWNNEKVITAYLYMPLNELSSFVQLNCIEAKESTSDFFKYLRGKELEIALKNTRGIYILPYNTNTLDQSQWDNVEKNGEGVCVEVELMYDGWKKTSIYTSSLPPIISENTDGLTILTVRQNAWCLQYDGILSKINPSNPFIPFKITNIIKRNGEKVEVEGKYDVPTSTDENVEVEGINDAPASAGENAMSEKYDSYSHIHVDEKDNYDIAYAIGDYAEANVGDFAVVVEAGDLKMYVEGHLYVNNRGGQGELDYIKVIEGKLSEEDQQEIQDEFESIVSWS